MISQLHDVRARLRRETEQRVVLEIAFLRMARAQQLRSIGELAAELKQLRDMLTGSSSVSRVTPPRPVQPTHKSQNTPAPAQVKMELSNIPLTEFNHRWDEVVEAVVNTSRSMWVKAYLPMARLSRITDTSVTIHLPPFVLTDTKGSFEQVDLQRKVADSLKNVCGEEVSVTLVADEALRPSKPAADKHQITPSDEDTSETIKLIKNVFPGAIVEGP